MTTVDIVSQIDAVPDTTIYKVLNGNGIFKNSKTGTRNRRYLEDEEIITYEIDDVIADDTNLASVAVDEGTAEDTNLASVAVVKKGIATADSFIENPGF